MIKQLLLTSALVLGTVAVPVSAATLTASATDPFNGAGRAGGVRYRALANNSGQARAFGGYHDLGVAANQKANIAAPEFNYGALQNFSLSYDGTSTMTFTLGGVSRSFNDFEANLGAAFTGKSLNRLSFVLRDGSPAGQLTLSNLVVNGVSFDGVSSADGISYFTTGGNFRDAFSVTGTLGRINIAGGSESNSLQVLVGNAVPEPAAWAMMIGGFGLVGAAMRRRTSTKVSFA